MWLVVVLVILVLVGWTIHQLRSPSKLNLYYHDDLNKLPVGGEKEDEKGKVVMKVRWLDYLLSSCPSLSGGRDYYPTPWLRNGHLQTYYTSRVSDKGKLVYEREVVSMEDGGQVGLDWYLRKPNNNNNNNIKPIVLILHGLTGSSQEGYCRSTVKRLGDTNNFTVVVLNSRGCGGLPILTQRLFNAGDTRDLQHILQYLKTIFPETKIYATGFSLGANLLSKYLGESGESSLISGAISVGNPWDLLDSSLLFLTVPIMRYLYDPTMVKGLVNILENNPILKENRIIRKWLGIRGFDRAITKVNGQFRTVNDYYRWGSSDQYVTGIKVPFLVLNSRDDPVSPELAIPFQECRQNPNILLAVTDHGGHIGWWSHTTHPRHWFPSLIQEYLEALHEVHSHQLPSTYLLTTLSDPSSTSTQS